MQISGQTGAFHEPSAFVHGIDTSHIIGRVASVKEARALPPGSVVGDVHGGLTFTDAVAAVLERRSLSGWQEIQKPGGESWTLIVVNR
jgi:hypothetical protein